MSLRCLQDKDMQCPGLIDAGRPGEEFPAAGAGADLETAIGQAPSVLYASFVTVLTVSWQVLWFPFIRKYSSGELRLAQDHITSKMQNLNLNPRLLTP